MTRAEEAALKAYPQKDDKFYEVVRECYVEGYEQAEKDLAQEPSKGLEEAAAHYERDNRQSILSSVDIVDAFKAGAEWQKHRAMPRQQTAYINGRKVETR